LGSSGSSVKTLPGLVKRCMSSTPLSWAEAVDALRYTNNKSSQNMLDRSRGFLTAKKYSYRIVGTEDIDHANSLLYDTYHPDEPLNKHLGLTAGGRRIKDCDAMVQDIIPRHLSMFALDPAGKPIGVAINNACHKSELEVPAEQLLSQCLDSDYKPILAIHHKLRQDNIHIYDELSTDKFFSIRMIGVENSQRGMGVATELIRRSILLAGCMGFQGIKTEATGKFSKTAFETVGMLPSSSINYEDFEFEGRKVFSGMEGENNEIYFMKKKFFQSCLNHII